MFFFQKKSTERKIGVKRRIKKLSNKGATFHKHINDSNPWLNKDFTQYLGNKTSRVNRILKHIFSSPRIARTRRSSDGMTFLKILIVNVVVAEMHSKCQHADDKIKENRDNYCKYLIDTHVFDKFSTLTNSCSMLLTVGISLDAVQADVKSHLIWVQNV